MSGNEESLQQQLREALEKVKEGERREKEAEEGRAKAEEREKRLEHELRQTIARLETKDSELRKLSTGKSGFPIEGSFQWEVELAKTGEELIFSPYTDIGGLPFRIGCKTAMRTDKRLDFYLHCNDNAQIGTFSASIAFTLKLVTPKEPCIKSFYTIFTPSNVSMGWLDSSMDWNFDPAKGRIHNGHITIEAQIKVIWSHKKAITDFTSPDPDLSDVILLVEDKVFHADKKYLAHYAGYFKASFSNFAEKNKDSVKLEEVNAVEFEEMLRVIYPDRKEVATATVNGLLRMADFFDVPTVFQVCTKFLMNSTDFSIPAKLKLSAEFRLQELQDNLMEGMKSANDIKVIIKSADFEQYSLFLRNSLLEKYFKLSLG